MRCEQVSRAGLIDATGNLPEMVFVEKAGRVVEVNIRSLTAGDVVVVAEGQLIAADGTVISGVADVDQQRLTGESKLFEKSEGDRVFAGTTVLFGTLHIRVEQAGGETILARIGTILNKAANCKLELETWGARMTDRAALPTLAMAGLAWLGLGVTGALGIFGNYLGANLRILSPMNLLNALSQASDKGILIKDGRSLEAIAEIDTVVFDKTGTLTTDNPEVSRIHVWSYFKSEEDLLAAAAAMESRQSHPIARAIQQAAEGLEVPLIDSNELTYRLGRGIRARLGSKNALLGSLRFLIDEDVEIPPHCAKDIIFMEGNLSRIPDLFAVTDQLTRTSKTCMTVSVVSPLITAGGVFFLHVGVIASTFVHMIGLGGGLHICNRRIFTDKWNHTRMVDRGVEGRRQNAANMQPKQLG